MQTELGYHEHPMETAWREDVLFSAGKFPNTLDEGGLLFIESRRPPLLLYYESFAVRFTELHIVRYADRLYNIHVNRKLSFDDSIRLIRYCE